MACPWRVRLLPRGSLQKLYRKESKKYWISGLSAKEIFIGVGGRGPLHGLRIHSARGGLPGKFCPPFVRSSVRPSGFLVISLNSSL